MSEHRNERADEQTEQLDALELPELPEQAEQRAGAHELPAQATVEPPEQSGAGPADELEQLDDAPAGRPTRFALYDTRLRRYVGGVSDERPSLPGGDPSRFEIREV